MVYRFRKNDGELPLRSEPIVEAVWSRFCLDWSGSCLFLHCPSTSVSLQISAARCTANDCTAFENIGEDAAGYNLGMGSAVIWITPLVIGAVVDRNAIATRDLRSNLNQMFSLAREALRSLDGEYSQLIDVDGLPKSADLRIDNELLDGLPEYIFAEFAGQGRLRWHRGVAHPILAGIEKSYAAEYGREWFEHGEAARAAMLLPYADEGFNVMDLHLLLRIVAAFAIIYGNLGAGFLISYFTPPVGVSCRTFGYLVFGISTFLTAILETILEITSSPNSTVRRYGNYGLITLEAINVCWLLATVIAQTFGFYQTCFCLSAGFDRRGGYIQFDDVENNTSDTIFAVWSISVGVAGSILLGSLAYFVIEWLEQGHLNTFDYENAQKGLLWSRRFKKVRGWLLSVPMLPVNGLVRLWRLVLRRKQVKRTRMVWSS
jgi:hypothetical protein